MGSGRWNPDRIQDDKIRSALQAAKDGRIQEFAFIRKMMDDNGRFRSMCDRLDVESMCRKLSILSQDLQAWRIQYDALPQGSNN